MCAQAVASEGTKRCSRCGADRPLGDFFLVGPRRPGVRRGTCRDCDQAYNRAYYARRKADRSGTRVCRVCGAEKSASAFPVIRATCNDCIAASIRDRYISDEAFRVRVLAKTRPNTDHRRGIADSDWANVLRRDVCAYCGHPAGSVDHIEPDLSQGTFENLTGACGGCNSAKAQKPLLIFLLDRATKNDQLVQAP